jgi:hypothetical protein
VPPKPRERRTPPTGQRRLITKIATSLVSFWVTFGISELLPENQQPEILWSIGASLFVAGVVFIAQYLLEVESRIDVLTQGLATHQNRMLGQFERHARETERLMREGFSKIQLAEELFGLREASQLHPEEISQIARLVRNRTKIISGAPRLIQDFAQAELARMAEYLKQMSDRSDLTYEGEDRDWLLGLTRVARHEIQAASLSTVNAEGRGFIDGGLWFTEFGQRYLAAQRHAIRTRDVRVQRVFILDQRIRDSEELHHVLRMHLGVGIEVRILDAAVAPAAHGRPHDFVLFDRMLSYETTTTVSNLDNRLSPVVVNITLVTEPERVARRVSDFADLWSARGVQAVTLDARNKLVFRPVVRPPSAPSPDATRRYPPGPAATPGTA